jgi:hypothetical protein
VEMLSTRFLGKILDGRTDNEHASYTGDAIVGSSWL